MHKLTPLCELARKYQTDKGGAHNHYAGYPNDGTHGYTPIYYQLLKDRATSVRTVFEIGVNSGASLRMWRDFFPFALVIGVDIEKDHLFSDLGIACYYADASNAQSLHDAVVRSCRNTFDLIVDDGSHDPAHQKIAVQAMCQYLSPTGIMVVEDIRPTSLDDVASAVPAGFEHTVMMSEPGSGKYAHQEPLLVIRRTGNG